MAVRYDQRIISVSSEELKQALGITETEVIEYVELSSIRAVGYGPIVEITLTRRQVDG